MKILMITPDYPPVFGGIGNHTYEIARAIKRLGHEVIVIIARMRQRNDAELEYQENRSITSDVIDGIWTIDLHTGIQMLQDEKWQNSDFFKSEEYHAYRMSYNIYDVCNRLMDITSELEFDIIHLQDAFSGVAAVLLKERFRCPLIVTIHGVNAEKNILLDSIKRFTVFNANKVISVSEATKRKLAERYDYHEEIEVIYNSVKLTGLDLSCRQISTDPYKLVFCGRIERSKGLEDLICAIWNLHQQGINVKLHVLGEGSQKKAIQELIDASGMNDNVVFNGFVNKNEMLEIYKDALCVVFPSRKEPFSTATLEAMELGINVICTEVDGFKEMIENGKNGVLFSPRDISGLCAAIMKLISNKEYRENMAKRGRDTVRENYVWDIAAKKTLEVYEQMKEEHTYE